MRIAGVNILVLPGRLAEVLSKLKRVEAVEVVDTRDDAVAAVIEAPTPKEQESRHKEIENWPEVSGVAVVFQTGEV